MGSIQSQLPFEETGEPLRTPFPLFSCLSRDNNGMWGSRGSQGLSVPQRSLSWAKLVLLTPHVLPTAPSCYMFHVETKLKPSFTQLQTFLQCFSVFQ